MLQQNKVQKVNMNKVPVLKVQGLSKGIPEG